MMKKIFRIVLIVLTTLLSLILILAIIFFVINRNLPVKSETTDRLSQKEKAHISEIIHLRKELGDTVWSGWGKIDFPLIVYNEEYTFLIGYDNPPAGWYKIPQMELRGKAWEKVPDDLFLNKTYYRQRLENSNINPEAFAVLVGNKWVASLPTKEFMEIEFYKNIKEQMPSLLRPFVPYSLLFNVLMGETDTYIAACEHEFFHAYQGVINSSRLFEAETLGKDNSFYPWWNPQNNSMWVDEINSLLKAFYSNNQQNTLYHARRFIIRRNIRRGKMDFTPALTRLEQKREWLEGLAKYVEVSIGKTAKRNKKYDPVPAMLNDPDFKQYKTRISYWSQQIDEATRLEGRDGEVRFYYSGLLQALVLDKIISNWKEKILTENLFLEDILESVTVN